MFCFIPSWYSKRRTWQMYDRQFYRAADFGEFDDTVSQIRMFLDEGEPVRLIPLFYAPNLRRFLHRQGIMQVPVTSVFDEIQNIHGDETAVISYRDLPWPEDVEWSYTPFLLAAYVQDEHIANVEFDEDGNMLWVNYYVHENGNETLARRYAFDDRGFVSSILYFDQGKAIRRDYFDREGIWQIREDCVSGEVTVNPAAAGSFAQNRYASLAELIAEKFSHIAEQLSPEDTLVLAASERHDALVLGHRQGHKAILSFFGDRYDLEHTAALQTELPQVSAVVADTEETAQRLRNLSLSEPVRIYDISPFDTRLSLGRSQQVRALKIFFPVDGLQEPIRTRAIRQILFIMQDNSKVELTIVTRSSDAGMTGRLTAYLEDLVHGLPGKRLYVENAQTITGENTDPGEAGTDAAGAMDSGAAKETRKPRIFIRNCMKESDITRELQDTRLIVDVRDTPDQYIQIAGISTGIPQVNYRNTRYIEHQKNGYMIHNIANLGPAVRYYLDGLAHWNEALVYCIRQISAYTGSRIVDQWKEMAGT